MKHRRLLAWALALVMAVGVLPVLPGNIKSVNAAEAVTNVMRSLTGITAPDGGWGADFTDSTFKFAKDSSITGVVDMQAMTESAYADQPEQWKAVLLESTSSTTASAIVPASTANGGESFEVIVTLRGGNRYDQMSAMIYDSTSDKVLAYGRIGESTSGSKTFIVPTGMETGSYKLWIFLEKFGEEGEADTAFDIGTVPFSLKTSGASDACDVTINFDLPIKRMSGGAIAQTKISGAMTPVVIGLSDTSKYYFPEDYESLGTADGITVKRDSLYQLTISGTPTEKTTEVNLVEPATKATQSTPSVTGGNEKLSGTNANMEYANSPDATNWTTCDEGETAVPEGVWYVRNKGTDTRQPSNAVEVQVAAPAEGYYVLINLPDDAHMTRDISSGAAYQAGLTNAMKTVIYNADNGYYFPENYPVETKNGVTLARTSSSQIQISGTPEDNNVSFTLQAASRIKSNPSAPSNVAGDVMKITGTTSAMEYSDEETPGEWKDCQDGETPVDTAGVKNVRYKETERANSGEVKQVTVLEDSNGGEETQAEGISVLIENPTGNNITIGVESEGLYYQTGIKGSMRDVVYYADGEYYFPTSYKVAPVNGVRVVRSGAKMLTVKGVPTESTVIRLQPAVSINTPLYDVTVVNGTGTEKYVAGTAVEIEALEKSGQTFTGWRVNSGNVTLANSKSKATTFIMPAEAVEVEACYSTGSSSSDSGSSGDSSGGSTASGSSGGSTSGGNNDNGSSGGNSSSGGTTVPGDTTVVVAPVSSDVYANNSKVLDITAKVVWSKGAWKLTWNSISGAEGYDIYLKEGKGTPASNSYVQVTGNGSTTAYIKSVSGKAIDRTKIYSFVVKAYRVVNKSKDYLGTSRVLYAAGDKNKTYTNVKTLKPSKKSVSVAVGKTKKLQTKYKKQKSSRKLVSNSAGKKLSYYSSDTSIATVSSSGKVKGIRKGTCYVYAVAHNGVRTRVKITVK